MRFLLRADAQKLILAIVAALFSSASAAFACGGNPANHFCTMIFWGGMSCNGGDQLAVLTPNWEGVPIYITKVQASSFQANTIQYMYAGNSYTADVMALSGYGEVSTHSTIPDGAYMLLPTDPNHHVDLHVSCIGGSFQAFYVVSYWDVKPSGP